MSVPFSLQELCPQHLSKSPKCKRAIPGVEEMAVTPEPCLSVPCLTTGSSRLPCSSGIISVQVLCIKTWSKACPCGFCTKAMNHQERELAMEEMGILGAWLGSPAYVNLCTSTARVRTHLRHSPEFMLCSCSQVLSPSLDLGLQPLLGCSFNCLWVFILGFSSGSGRHRHL